MQIEMIPLSKLVPSPANVRKTGADTGLDELAASIAAHGLLQNLSVRPGAGGYLEVVAGGAVSPPSNASPNRHSSRRMPPSRVTSGRATALR